MKSREQRQAEKQARQTIRELRGVYQDSRDHLLALIDEVQRWCANPPRMRTIEELMRDQDEPK